MKKIILEKVINLVREQMATAALGPTNRTGEFIKNFDPVMKKPIKRKKTIGLWSGSLKKKKKKKRDQVKLC